MIMIRSFSVILDVLSIELTTLWFGLTHTKVDPKVLMCKKNVVFRSRIKLH